MLKKVLGFFLICIVVLSCASCQSSGITIEQYNQIEDDMTYEQVKEIFQDDGELYKEVGQIGTDDYYMYRSWKLKDGSTATMSFGGTELVLTSKTKRSY